MFNLIVPTEVVPCTLPNFSSVLASMLPSCNVPTTPVNATLLLILTVLTLPVAETLDSFSVMSTSKPPAETDSIAPVPTTPVSVTELPIPTVLIAPVADTPVSVVELLIPTVLTEPVADTPDTSSLILGDTVPIDPVADTLPSLSDISISKPPAATGSIAPVPATPVKVNETLRVPKVEPPYTPVPVSYTHLRAHET